MQRILHGARAGAAARRHLHRVPLRERCAISIASCSRAWARRRAAVCRRPRREGCAAARGARPPSFRGAWACTTPCPARRPQRRPGRHATYGSRAVVFRAAVDRVDGPLQPALARRRGAVLDQQLVAWEARRVIGPVFSACRARVPSTVCLCRMAGPVVPLKRPPTRAAIQPARAPPLHVRDRDLLMRRSSSRPQPARSGGGGFHAGRGPR